MVTSTPDSMEIRVQAILGRIAAACARARRATDEVTLVAVSKTYPPDAVREAAACGLRVFGESRVQEARQKAPLCPGGVDWHLIGHLQRNKVRLAVRLFTMVHAVDSPRLLEALDAACGEAGVTLPVCLEVNVSGEAAKYGFAPDEVPAALDMAARLMRLEVEGVMTIPPFDPDPEHARPYFARLRSLRDGWAAASGFPLRTLSMGMSSDFEVAIEEGATLVRIGTALFGPRL
jgi:PLP dependent protein